MGSDWGTNKNTQYIVVYIKHYNYILCIEYASDGFDSRFLLHEQTRSHTGARLFIYGSRKRESRVEARTSRGVALRGEDEGLRVPTRKLDSSVNCQPGRAAKGATPVSLRPLVSQETGARPARTITD